MSSEDSQSVRVGSTSPSPASLRDRFAEFSDLLTADQQRTIDLISSLTRSFTSIVEAAQLTATDDEHDPEGSTIAFERSQTSALLTSANKHLAEIDRALERIADGTYGICGRCGGPILLERLQARPAARTCIGCADMSGRHR